MKVRSAATAIALAALVAGPAYATNGGGYGGGGNNNNNNNSGGDIQVDIDAYSHNDNTAFGGAGGNAAAFGGSANATGGSATANGGNATGGNATGGSAFNHNWNSSDNNLTTNNTNQNSADNNGNLNGNLNGNNNGNNNGHNGNNNGNGNGNNNGNNNSRSSNSQSQGQLQGQSQSVSNDTSNSNNSSQDVSVNTYNERAPVNTAFAAPLTTGEDTCMGSSSLGAQAVSFGVSVGTTWQDANCRRLKNSRQLVALGYHRAATALMCVDEDVRHAMEEAGTPCPTRENAPAQVTPASAPVTAPCPADDFVVPFDWDRSNLNRTAAGIIDEAVARARQCNVSGVIVIGHTDTSGSNAYNAGLSQRRAVVVRNAMIERGIRADLIQTEARGESDLARQTGNGVREGANRRTAVTISFR
ncbi:MAG: OmpA family protein [Hyphomonadaceae bacterium]|nr:OmpA family protein [Hyphomonadaceae bacterium]